jgi:hypothetical protein
VTFQAARDVTPAEESAPGPALVLEPSPKDYRLAGARYERFAAVLRDRGWDARIRVNEAERRSAVTELVVRLLDQPAGAAVDALVELLTAHVSQSLTRLHKERGRVVIYSATGSVLRIVEVARSESEPGRPERRRAHKRP